MSVGILVVSHSEQIGAGVAALARQMAPDVHIAVAAGTDDGGLGTSFDRVSAALEDLRDLSGTVVLCDLGSAYMTVDAALDFLDDEHRQLVSVSDAPLVEGVIAAAVAAQGGGDRDAVVAAAGTAWDRPSSKPSGASQAARQAGEDSSAAEAAQEASASVELPNPSGLHARPAADFVRTAARFDARIRVNGVDAKSLLAIMALALPQGSTVAIEASGPEARPAVDALVSLVESGFGEL